MLLQVYVNRKLFTKLHFTVFISFQSSLDNSNTRTVIREPSPIRAVCKKVILSTIFVLIYLKFLPLFPIKTLKEENFMENTSLLYKFWYIYVSTLLVRLKYYFAWVLADAVCNNCGIGFSGFDENGVGNWDKFSNVHILKFEVKQTFNEEFKSI